MTTLRFSSYTCAKCGEMWVVKAMGNDEDYWLAQTFMVADVVNHKSSHLLQEVKDGY